MWRARAYSTDRKRLFGERQELVFTWQRIFERDALLSRIKHASGGHAYKDGDSDTSLHPFPVWVGQGSDDLLNFQRRSPQSHRVQWTTQCHAVATGNQDPWIAGPNSKDFRDRIWTELREPDECFWKPRSTLSVALYFETFIGGDQLRTRLIYSSLLYLQNRASSDSKPHVWSRWSGNWQRSWERRSRASVLRKRRQKRRKR